MRFLSARVLLSIFIGLAIGHIQPGAARSVDYAQRCVSNVANVTVHAAPDANLSLSNGNTIEVGDTVAVYTKRGNCVGYGVWDDTNGITLAAAGILTDTASTAGYLDGEQLHFEVFDVSANQRVDIDPADTEYVPCDSTGVPFCTSGTYEKDAFVQLSRFATESTAERKIATSEGWNLLSIPVESEPESFSSLLPSCEQGFFFLPTSGYEAIDPDGTVSPERGLFAQCARDTVQVNGSRVHPEVTVEQGWNAIGSFADTVSADAISSSPEGILRTSIYRMTANGGYEAASVLRPGEGYWVRLEEAGTLNLSGSSSKTQPKLASGQAGNSRSPSASRKEKDPARLLITDRNGREKELFLMETLTQEQERRYLLPPIPPRGVFDIRFSGGTSAAAYATTSSQASPPSVRHRIKIQGASFPLTLRLRSEDFDHSIRVAPNGEDIVLSPEEPTGKLTHPSEEIVLDTEPRPEGFRLAKARPNPIRGRGQIQYAVPTSTRVSITLFDILGRRVARLVDGRQEPGVHNIEIPAERLSSGTYFARMQAESFQQTQRLTIVR